MKFMIVLEDMGKVVKKVFNDRKTMIAYVKSLYREANFQWLSLDYKFVEIGNIIHLGYEKCFHMEKIAA